MGFSITEWKEAYRKADSMLTEANQQIMQLATERTELQNAIKQAIDYAGGRESEWGERAEQCFTILNNAIRRTGE